MATRRREDFDGAAKSQGKARILIADASKIMRLAVSKILEDEYELVEAVSATEAWDMLQSVRVHAVMMSLNLPDLRAYGLLERIRDARPTALRNLPVAIIAEDSAEERARAKTAGADNFIPKPFDSEQLKESTRSLLHTANREPSTSAQERTERESTMVDPLTGLPNRSYFFYRGPKELSFAQRHGKDLAVIFVQMDNMDNLISDYGRPVVKQLLRKLSKYIGIAVRAEDTVARVGARRFAVIAPTTNEFGAKEVADRVLQKVRATYFNYGGKKITFTVSMGLAAPRVHSVETFDQVVDVAAQRLDMAVWAGGNRLVFGNQKPEPVDEAESDSDENVGAEVDMAADTALQTAVRPSLPDPAEPPARPAGDETTPAPASDSTSAKPAADASESVASIAASIRASRAASATSTKTDSGFSAPPADTPASSPQREPVVSPPAGTARDNPLDHPLGGPASEPEDDASSPDTSGISLTETFADAPALEVAMWMLENGQAATLRPHLASLLKEILPLLEHGSETLQIDIRDAIKLLRERLD